MEAIRWFTRNLSTLLLAFTLAVIVWASAVVTSDPNQQNTIGSIPIEIIGQPTDLVLTNEVPDLANLTIVAPSSIWDQLRRNPGLIRTWIDLSGYEAGEHIVTLEAQVEIDPHRIIQIDPESITVVLEELTTRVFPVRLQVTGEPPLGYNKGIPSINPEEVTIIGPKSLVDRVVETSASLNISGSIQTIKTTVPVRALDQNGAIVQDITINPREISVIQPISILGGYKNVAVKVVTSGQVANGYRLTNISVTPPSVTVYSSDPQLVDELPGYVETLPVDLDGLTDDAEFNKSLNLPEGITLVSEPSVLVQIGVAAIEGSLSLTLPIETLGLPPELVATISPPAVDVIVNGPLPVLETLTPDSFRVVVDLTDLGAGVYQIKPQLDLIPDEVQIQAILPESVEVLIEIAPTPTPALVSGLIDKLSILWSSIHPQFSYL